MGGFIRFDSRGHQGLEAHIAIPQKVGNYAPGIEILDVDKICIACYFRPEKYSCDEVREYYDRMILHMVEGLGIEGYQAHNFEGLLKLQKDHNLTHVFMAQTEYEENSAYYEELAETMPVVVIAERNFILPSKSRLLVLRKPFFVLSVVNLLNGRSQENGFGEDGEPGSRPFSCTGVRALAVDDEEMNLVVAKGILGSYGMEVDTCLSGRMAVERCKHTSYDIIFLDHMMPGFDGVETLKCIREMNNGSYLELPVVALTANTISGAREMFKNEGFTEFVPKPIERSVLERALRRVLPKELIQYGEEDSEKEVHTLDEDADLLKPEEGMDDHSHMSRYDLLIRAGINVKMGLDYCCGEEEFYEEMLQMFCSQREERKEEIIAFYEAGNWPDYAVKVHALKSTSLTIGAEELSAYAKSLEMAGKKGDVDYIIEHHPALLRMYDEICESIAG